ncbi:MAG TPA: EamA family transporter [Bryobacteraceae bacterium]|nr:EamA family transporter [Bryobacteraceae bacterium]
MSEKWVYVMVIVACNATGDLLNAYGMRQQGRVMDFHPSALRRLIRKLAHNRYVIGGVIAMAVAFFALLSLLSIADLSFAIPATSASYLIETVLAKVILREEVHWQRWLGAFVVAGGVALLSI